MNQLAGPFGISLTLLSVLATSVAIGYSPTFAHADAPRSALPQRAAPLKIAPPSLSVVHSAPVSEAPSPAGDDPAAELMKSQEEYRKSMDSINALNPFSAEYGKGGASGATALTGPLEPLQKLLSNPAVKGYLRFFSNPAFSRGVDQVMNSPLRMNVLYGELGLIVFMLIFRAWRFSKSSHWFMRLWTNLWTFCMFWVGAIVLVPWAVLGTPYYNTVYGALMVLTQGK